MACHSERPTAMAANQSRMKEGLVLQALVFVLTVVSLVFSAVSHIRSDLNTDEMLVIRERVRRLEIQVTKMVNLPDHLPRYTHEKQQEDHNSQEHQGHTRVKRTTGNGGPDAPVNGRKGVKPKLKLEIKNEIRLMMGSLAQVFCTKEESICFSGAKGDKGDTGSTGAPGVKGQPGLQGPRGVTGDPGISVSIPIITVPPKVVTIQESRSTSLWCRAEGFPVPEVTWSRVDGSLPEGRHVIHGNGTLVITGARPEDGGMYVCRAKNVLGKAESPTLVIVHVPVRFTKKPSQVIIEEGREAKLLCQASGHPEPAITWSAASRELRTPAEELIKGQLVIINATINDSDTYTCSAKNDVNEVKVSARVSVLPRLVIRVRPVAKQRTHILTSVSLHCQANIAAIKWSKKGGRLPKAHKVLSNGTLLLNISSVGDGGLYVCAAMNSIAAVNVSSVVKVYARSCSEWRIAGLNRSGVYKIKPDGKSPGYAVFCNMTGKGGVGVSLVSHDTEDRTAVEGFMEPGSYLKDVTYSGATMAQIIRLIDASAHCEQFIKYECHHSVLLWEGSSYGWWVSRDGQKMTYWGGATPGSRACACGMNNTCATGGACNCDANDITWREDSGLLTDKASLPVSQLRFGDTGDPRDERGFHTLGKLKCYGVP